MPATATTVLNEMPIDNLRWLRAYTTPRWFRHGNHYDKRTLGFFLSAGKPTFCKTSTQRCVALATLQCKKKRAREPAFLRGLDHIRRIAKSPQAVAARRRVATNRTLPRGRCFAAARPAWPLACLG